MKRLKKVLMDTDRLRISMKTLDNGRQLVFNGIFVNLQNIPKEDREPEAGKSGRLFQFERLMHRIALPDNTKEKSTWIIGPKSMALS